MMRTAFVVQRSDRYRIQLVSYISLELNLVGREPLVSGVKSHQPASASTNIGDEKNSLCSASLINFDKPLDRQLSISRLMNACVV